LQQITSGDAEVDCTFSAKCRNVIRSQENDVYRQLLNQGEESPLLAAKLKTSLIQ
jgi:hypothetical protein